MISWTLKTKKIPKSSDLMDGIIQYLQNSTNKTFLNNIGLVSVTASSDDGINFPENIFTDGSNSTQGYWASDLSGNSWIQLDFHQNAVLITEYAIYAYGRDFLQKWDSYCSYDNKNWHLIHHIEMTERPQETGLTSIPFDVEEPLICRYFKIVQRSTRWGYETGTDQDNHFIIHKLELFGIFYNSSSLHKLFKTFPHFHNNIHFFALLFHTIILP